MKSSAIKIRTDKWLGLTIVQSNQNADSLLGEGVCKKGLTEHPESHIGI